MRVKILKVNLYIAFSVLFLTGAFWCLCNTVHAEDDGKKVYVYYGDNNNIDTNDLVQFYMEHNRKDESDSVSEETQSKEKVTYEKEKEKDSSEPHLAFTLLVIILLPIGIFFSILKYYLNNSTSSGLSLFGQFGDSDFTNEEPTDLINVTIGEASGQEAEPTDLVNVTIGEALEQEAEPTDLVNVTIGESSDQEAEATDMTEAVTDEKSEKKTEAVRENVLIDKEIDYDQSKDCSTITNEYVASSDILNQQNAQIEEDSKKELTRQQLKEVIKNLDSAERNKFVELAKNGKTSEAIEACVEVTGLDITDAQKIIALKLYY